MIAQVTRYVVTKLPPIFWLLFARAHDIWRPLIFTGDLILMNNAQIYTKKVNGPATHAIVIGVGHYLHLPGGQGKKNLPNTGMEQLKSPPVSARAIAQWLIEEYKHPDKPLASVSLLLSDRTDNKFTFSLNGKKKTVTVQPADMAHVRPAVEAWREIGNKRADHLLLFFFCGHGIAAGSDLGLLLSDFGAKSTAPLDGAIDFRKFWRGMDECAAREQCYFIDACRVGSDLLIKNAGFAGQPIIQNTGAFNTTGNVRRAPIFFSTVGGTTAYAKPGKPSLYTDALLEALGGAGSGDEKGPWRVSTILVQRALNFLVKDASERLAVPEVQITSSDELTEIELNVVTTPQVPVVVTCTPKEKNAQAMLSCENTSYKNKRKPAKDTWRLRLPIDSYNFVATINSDSYSQSNFPVKPMYRVVELKVK